MADNELMRPEDIELAIARASQKEPMVAKARQKIDKAVGGINTDEGARVLVEAIRRLMRQEP